MTGRQVIVPAWWKLSANEADVLRWTLLGDQRVRAAGEGFAAAELAPRVTRGVDVRVVIRKLERRGLLERLPPDRARWACSERGRWWLYGLEYGFVVRGQVEAAWADYQAQMFAIPLAPGTGEATFPRLPDPPVRGDWKPGLGGTLAILFVVAFVVGGVSYGLMETFDLVAHAVRGGRP